MTLAVIDLTRKKATKSVIQKLCYFLNVNNILDAEFRPHLFGPYSDDVGVSLVTLVGAGFVDEVAGKFETPYSYWMRRKYTYTVTEDGETVLRELRKRPEYDRIKEIIEKCGKLSNFSLDILAAAAKIYYMLKKEESEIHKSQILERAKTLGWEIDDQSVEKAVDLLETLTLTR